MIVDCPSCKQPFVQNNKRKKHCERPECVKERQRITSASTRERERGYHLYGQVRYYRKKKLCACGKTHRNYFDKCDTCRERIMNTYDLSMMV